MKRNRRRRERKLLARLGAALRVAGLLAAASLAVAGAGRLADWVSGHPYFRLQDIDVTGTRDREAILAWAGIRTGQSVLRLDPRRLERRLEGHPRIRTAAVRRELPGKLRIAVEERRPLAVVLLEEPLFVDREGALFPPEAREMLDDRPYVTGLRPDDLVARPAWTAARLREAAEVLEMWQRHPDWPAVSEVRPEENGEIVVFPQEAKMTIRFGKEVTEEQFSRLSAVLELWRGREAQVSGIDLTVPGQAVLRLRDGAPSARRLRI